MFRHLTLGLTLLGCVVGLQGAVFTFVPHDRNGDPDDLWDLNHEYWYTWGFKGITIPAGEVITEAVLTIADINNWTAAENDGRNWLRMYLLDTADNPFNLKLDEALPPAGRLRRYSDTDNGTDNIAGLTWTAKTHIATYTDFDGGPAGDVVILAYSFASLGLLDELTTYIANGHNFGLAFDPDCHYWNSGVQFTIHTAPRRVPEGGSTLIFLAFGVGTATLWGRRRSA